MIVSNYTDLSPAMRDALIGRSTTRRGTADALVRRNLVSVLPSRDGAWPLELTETGERARATFVEPDKAIPAKVASLLEKAEKRGLEIKEEGRGEAIRRWTISSPNPIDEEPVDDMTTSLHPEGRQPFPRLPAALEGVQRTLADQGLNGWAAGMVEPKRIVVNLPNGTDPTRHLELLARHVPYRASVTLLNSTAPTRWPVIVISPLEDS